MFISLKLNFLDFNNIFPLYGHTYMYVAIKVRSCLRIVILEYLD